MNTLKSIIYISVFLFSHSLFASALVCIEGDELVVKSNLVFYGGKAREAGAECAEEINRMFNKPRVKIEMGDLKLKVKFDISYEIKSEQAVVKRLNKSEKSNVINNYIRIEDKGLADSDGISSHLLEANCGYFSYADNLGTSTTCAHEYAHGLGLKHYTEKNYSDYGHDGDLRGKGRPGIMAARGFWVDRKYRYNKKANIGERGSTINPTTRIVREEDILNLNLDFLEFNDEGCAELGMDYGIAFNKDGSYIAGKRWFALNALVDKTYGDAPKNEADKVCKPDSR